MSVSRASSLAIAAVVLACAGAPLSDRAPPGPVAGRVARVAVHGDVGLAADDARWLAATVRQSARDWLEANGRLADAQSPEAAAALEVDVALTALRLRAPVVTWLFAWAAAPDRLAARVRVTQDGVAVAEGPLRVESALAGYRWRAREPRLERLARRLGQAVARGL